MDAPRFDRWTRSLTGTASRRSMLGLAGAALGLAATRFPGIATAKKKHKKKTTKKLTRNSFGCVDVGKACRGNSANCCSGICEGKKPKKSKKDKSKCVAHDAGTCQDGQDTCEGVSATCGQPGAYCYSTSGNASFCGFAIGGTCAICVKDTDCESTHGPGAACVVCPVSCTTTNTACIKTGAWPDVETQ